MFFKVYVVVKRFSGKHYSKDEQVFYDFDEDTLPYLFYRKAWDVGVDYRIISSEKYLLQNVIAPSY